MRIAHGWTIAFSVVVVVALLGVGFVLTRPRGPVLAEADFGLNLISPNADGEDDVTRITYRLRRDAIVDIYLENSTGDRFYFREDEIRAGGPYEVLFSGIVDGFVLEGETMQGTVEDRLVPDDTYSWVIEAEDRATGEVATLDGTLIVEGGDPELPDIWEFEVTPNAFTPNQDGIDDRVAINVFSPKPADLLVYLVDEEGNEIYIPEFQGGRAPGEAGRHSFEYDGGITNGSNPPPDGIYTVIVESTDEEGQRVTRTADLTLINGGVPFAEIVGQPGGDTVRFNTETVRIGDELRFTLTVENYGDAPIRTTGPGPGYVYDQDELYSATGYFIESGAWRVGINCDTCLTDYPWRWALGTQETLTAITDSRGNVHYYLMPGERAVITGAIRLTNIVEARNPQQFWAGLIHEDVAISPVNNFVDPRFITIVEAE